MFVGEICKRTFCNSFSCHASAVQSLACRLQGYIESTQISLRVNSGGGMNWFIDVCGGLLQHITYCTTQNGSIFCAMWFHHFSSRPPEAGSNAKRHTGDGWLAQEHRRQHWPSKFVFEGPFWCGVGMVGMIGMVGMVGLVGMRQWLPIFLGMFNGSLDEELHVFSMQCNQ